MKKLLALAVSLLFQACFFEPVEEVGEVQQPLGPKHRTLTLDSQVDDPARSFLSGAQACTNGFGCTGSPPSWSVYTLWQNPSATADLNNYWNFIGNYWGGTWGNVFKGNAWCHFQNNDTPTILQVTRVWWTIRYTTPISQPLIAITWPADNVNSASITQFTVPAFTANPAQFNYAATTINGSAPFTLANMGCDQAAVPRFGIENFGGSFGPVKIYSIKIQVDYDTTF